MTRLTTFIDLFLPNRVATTLDEENTIRHQRLIIAASFIFALICIGLPLFTLSLKGHFDATDPYSIAAGFVFLLHPIYIKRTGDTQLPVFILITSIVLLSIFASFIFGGLYAPNLPYLPIVVMATIFFLNVRVGILFTLASVVSLIAIYFNQDLFESMNVLEVTEHRQFQVSSYLINIIMAALLAWYYRTNQNRTITILKETLGDLKTANQALEEAKAKAEAATQAKSEFLANMSHEIRTPLNGVIGMAGLMLDTDLNRDQTEFVRTIRSSGDSLLMIINDILDFSKAEAGKIELENALFDLTICIEDALDLMAPNSAAKGLRLFYSYSPELPKLLLGDITRIRQILINLIGNGIKFTSKGHVAVHVTGERLPTGRVALKLAVEDTGIGIPTDRIDPIFQSFSQVDASTTRKFGGTGLGLSITKQLTELMGGEISVTSELGRGSTFLVEIELPIYEADTSRLSPVNSAQPSKTAALIHPYPPHRDAILDYLRSTPFIPTTLDDQAVTPADLARFDVIIVDDSAVRNNQPLTQTLAQIDRPVLLLNSVHSRALPESGWVDLKINKPIRTDPFHDSLLRLTTDNGSPPPHLDPSTANEGHSLCRLTVLVAEDNSVNQKVALKMLESRGATTDVAANGLEVLSALERRSYDLILMDVQMPEMDGVEATQRIHSRWGDTRPKIIALTANAMDGDRDRFLRIGMDDYVSKPVRPEALFRAIDRIFKFSAQELTASLE